MRYIFLSLIASLASAEKLDLSMLRRMSEQIRGEDDRLIRHSPSESTVRARNEICPFNLSFLVEIVSSNDNLGVRGAAAEVLHLCATQNAANKMDIGAVENGRIFDGIKELIHAGMEQFRFMDELARDDMDKNMDKIMRIGNEAGNVIAQASEAVWSLSDNNEINQKGFFKAGVVEELMNSIINCPVFFDSDGFCSAPNMWSLAALQNLASSHCDSESGYCDWQRNDHTRNLSLPSGVKQVNTIDQNIRSTIMDQIKDKGEKSFGKLMNYMVCGGPVNSPNDETYSWPGLAKYPHSMSHPEIIPWAAVGLLMNLAIDDSTRRYFSEQTEENGELFMCLCDIYRNTPDWLEENKATIAAYRLGWDDYCPDIHYRCTDKEGWAESETGKTCSDYESERLCASMGMKLGQGIPAHEACCVCGGGTETESNGKLSAGAMRDFQRIMESPQASGYGGNNQNCGRYTTVASKFELH